MNRKTILIVAALAVVEVVTSFSADAKADTVKKSGRMEVEILSVSHED
ncbi:MAG: hypothetical protein ACYSW4_02520 [Planctomycetota bacterium]|jgi:hypothetical protein